MVFFWCPERNPANNNKLVVEELEVNQKYGYWVWLHLGLFFAGDRGRRRSKFVLYRRQKANGVAPSQKYHVKSPQNSPAILNTQLHSISYTLSRNQAVIVEYAHDENTDLFQVIVIQLPIGVYNFAIKR